MSKFHRIAARRHGLRAPAFVMTALLAGVVFCAPSVHAQGAHPPLVLAQAGLNCSGDLKAMQERRMKLIDEFNKMAKSHGGKLDPITSCPKLRVLSRLEASFKAYMVKNKEWCGIPTAAIANVTASHAKTKALTRRVCAVAARYKKEQAAEAAGAPGAAPQKLPTGPL